MEIPSKKKIPFLVVDTSAFINNIAIQEIGEQILTVPDVLQEIKSKRQLRRLVVLPYDLSVKEVFFENVKFVNEFSKKTGDYSSLSATDINVIALTYQLEKEQNGVDHLKKIPIHKLKIDSTNISNDLKNISGFHMPKKLPSKLFSSQSLKCTSDDEQSEYDSAEEGMSENEVDIKEENCKLNKVVQSESNIQSKNQEELKESDYNEKLLDVENNIKEPEDDNDDWITPENIAQIKSQVANSLDEDLKNVTVACLTTDFAMQNVLKQIGLHVVSLDGKVIKQLRTFVLRCYGCFKTTSIMNKVFCPNCGNKTLKKVAVTINEDGSQHLHINFRKPLTARGKKFSLPYPKGGKHSNNPILCEDQPMPQQRASKLSRTKNNPLNDDYIAGYSPFVTRDVYSKSAMLGIRPYIEIKHWMRKNPNEVKKKNK